MEYKIYQVYNLYVITLSSLIYYYKIFQNLDIIKFLIIDADILKDIRCCINDLIKNLQLENKNIANIKIPGFRLKSKNLLKY